jgi:hypothetical protein
VYGERPIYGEGDRVWVNLAGMQTTGQVISYRGNGWYLVAISGRGAHQAHQSVLSPRAEGEGGQA